jgi:hypothetical protein
VRGKKRRGGDWIGGDRRREERRIGGRIGGD